MFQLVRGLSRASHDVDEVDDEHERLVGLDGAARPAAAVTQVRRDGELAPATHLHSQNSLVPAGDDLTAAEPETERVTPVVRRVELLAGRVRHPDVVHDRELTRPSLVAVADLQVLDDQIRGWRPDDRPDFRL